MEPEAVEAAVEAVEVGLFAAGILINVLAWNRLKAARRVFAAASRLHTQYMSGVQVNSITGDGERL